MMNKKEIFKKVGGIITELNEQFEYLSQNPDNLNELELELFAASSNFLSDHISILLKLNTVSSEIMKNDQELGLYDEPFDDELIKEAEDAFKNEMESVAPFGERYDLDDVENKEDVEIVEEVSKPDWKFSIENESVVSFDFEDKNTDELFDRPLTDEELRVINEKTQLKIIPEPESDVQWGNRGELENLPLVIPEEPVEVVQVDTIEFEPVSLVEEETQQPLTLNEILSTQSSPNTVSSQFNQRQSKDLKGLISLNDKLQFVRDLFNGYSLAYTEAIELLDRFDSFEAADNFLKQNYAVKNSWAEKQDVADKFYEILNRRFTK
ncbi:hypothetical protein [Daejeonella sp.]|uniref:hypothetical protein n=1 Tax=Daejeonella sp. TaxID=2805397 RepID=UPI0027B8FD3E|nr:hypothetical protein [Daejeonella sp.]